MSFISFLCVLSFVLAMISALSIWRLSRRYRLPGVLLWAVGVGTLGIAMLTAAACPYLGLWAKGFLAHILFLGGFGALWVGTRAFLRERLNRWYYLLVFFLMIVPSFGVFWYWFINPMYQARVTINCVTLLVMSLGICQSLFSSKVGERAVTIAGTCYLLFAILNGFRAIDMIMAPEAGNAFFSGDFATSITLGMIVVLFSAMIAKMFMIKDEIRFLSEND